MSHLRLNLFGGFQAELDDQPLTAFISNKARGLLIYLVLEADRAHSRAQLAGLFWPDLLDTQALAYLRHALTNLRRLLRDSEHDPPFLLVTRQTLQFNLASQYTVDVLSLHTLLSPLHSSADVHERLQLGQELLQYSTPLLAGFYLDGCPEFEAWLLLTRERLQRQIIEALQLLTALCEEAAHNQAAVQFAQQIVALEPWREEAHRQLMKLFARSGQRSAALAQYEQCKRLLSEELGVEPTAQTVELYQQIVKGAVPFAEAPVQASQRHDTPAPAHHNLPAPLTSLVGREQELAAVQQLFRQENARLVTLTGPGGVGKTRLGVAVAQALLPDFPDGVYFVELATVQEPDLVLSTLADTVGLRITGGSRSLVEQIVAQLRTQHSLLLLDNFEHVLKAAPFLTNLLTSCPHLKVLVTSRTLLRLRGEYEFVVSPLALDSEPYADTTIAAGRVPSSAVTLFCQRARAANAAFVLDATNWPFVAQICQWLDGMPLAIELAAVHMKYFTPQMLLAELTATPGHDALQLLRAELQDAPERQRSLWATVAWSYDLLTPEEQLLFRRLAIFVGGWTVGAAEAVCSAGLRNTLWNGLASLRDKHLIVQLPVVQTSGAAGKPRFRMLETIREFGLAQLERHDELLTMQRNHAHFFQAEVTRVAPLLNSHTSIEAITYLRTIYPNIRAALWWAITQKAVDVCLQFCDGLLNFWNVAYFKEAETYLMETVTIAEGSAPSVSYVNTLASAGYVAFLLGRQAQGRQFLERCLAMNEQLGNQGDPGKIGIAFGLLAWNRFDTGDYAAAYVIWDAAIEHAYRAEDDWNLAMQLVNLGNMHGRLGNLGRAQALIEEALAMHRYVGQKWGIAKTLKDLGHIYLAQGNFSQAKQVLQEGQKLAQEFPNKGMLAGIQLELAAGALAEADYPTATHLLREALTASVEEGLERLMLAAVDRWIHLAIAEARYARGLTFAGAFATHSQRLAMLFSPVERQAQAAYVAEARRHLTPEAATVAWAKGTEMTVDEIVTFAQQKTDVPIV